jgi:hypothetical protein
MKFKIGKHNYTDMSDKHIKSFKTKEEFVKHESKAMERLNIEEGVDLPSILAEVYDLVVPPKEEAPKESDAKKKAPAKEGDK